jgi:hypothetical protein
MKKQLRFILALIVMFVTINRKKSTIEKELYVISAQDSTAKTAKYKFLQPPRDPYKWYSDVVFIFDAKSKRFYCPTIAQLKIRGFPLLDFRQKLFTFEKFNLLTNRLCKKNT